MSSAFESRQGERCKGYRKRVLEVSQKVSALHAAPAFSCLEIVDCIYYDFIMNNEDISNRDLFIMSKGHGYLAQLVVLEALGLLPKHHLDEYCTAEGLLGAHPDLGIPGIKAATGSLGHGLGMAVGVALALINRSKLMKSPTPKVFCLLSDGELQEGSTWEAILIAGSLNVKNLFVVIDNNDFQSLGRTSDTHPNLYPIAEKFESFGFEARSIDGHKHSHIKEAITDLSLTERPKVIVAKTIKGKGVPFMESTPIWHYRSPSPEEYLDAIAHIDGEVMHEK